MPDFSQTLQAARNPIYEQYYIDYKVLKKKIKQVLERCNHLVHENMPLLEEVQEIKELVKTDE